MKPLLAASIDNDTPEIFNAQLQKITFPVIASPKLDGIRIPLHPTLGPVTRSLKPVRNDFVRTFLSDPLLESLDGEAIVGVPTAPNVFNLSTSGIMSGGGTPDFSYYVFDDFTYAGQPFELRLDSLRDRYLRLPGNLRDRVLLLEQVLITNIEQLIDYEAECLEKGFEGVMIRSLHGRYKFGRSTFKEGILIKMKRFEDAEGTIIGVEQLYENQNAAKLNELGYQTRSSHKANKIPLPMVGKIFVKNDEFPGGFGIGTGFDDAWRTHWWERRDELVGKLVTFRFQRHGTLEAPRIASFKGFREDL